MENGWFVNGSKSRENKKAPFRREMLFYNYLQIFLITALTLVPSKADSLFLF
jgi:hypothetical protein